MATERCAFCDAIATRWCDHVIGLGKDAKGVTTYHTCDLPTCERHKVTVGRICVRSGRRKHGGRCCHPIDLCALHHDQGMGFDRAVHVSWDELQNIRERLRVDVIIRKGRCICCGERGSKNELCESCARLEV